MVTFRETSALVLCRYTRFSVQVATESLPVPPRRSSQDGPAAGELDGGELPGAPGVPLVPAGGVVPVAPPVVPVGCRVPVVPAGPGEVTEPDWTGAGTTAGGGGSARRWSSFVPARTATPLATSTPTTAKAVATGRRPSIDRRRDFASPSAARPWATRVEMACRSGW
jgi:hypothetical protein